MFHSRAGIHHNTSYLAKRLAQPLSKPRVLHAARMIGPMLVAFTFAGLATVAHAQGTMDFSGAQTLMGTFNTYAIPLLNLHQSVAADTDWDSC
jgi:hypothetical protein